MEMDTNTREKFEQWISDAPYQRDVSRWPSDETKYAWPGLYKDIAVQLAWEAFCHGLAQLPQKQGCLGTN